MSRRLIKMQQPRKAQPRTMPSIKLDVLCGHIEVECEVFVYFIMSQMIILESDMFWRSFMNHSVIPLPLMERECGSYWPRVIPHKLTQKNSRTEWQYRSESSSNMVALIMAPYRTINFHRIFVCLCFRVNLLETRRLCPGSPSPFLDSLNKADWESRRRDPFSLQILKISLFRVASTWG